MATSGVRISDTTDEGDAPILVPPQLPPFLATVFDLQPIFGVPSDEEVRLVHGAMRSLNSLLHSPELRVSLAELLVELTQYLFDVQMVRHREKYAVGIFPNEIVYNPPNLPSHVPITLEAVVGPPTDDQLRSAHTALRVADSLMSVPSPVHIDLNMELSQHLFDLHFARHVQLSTQPRSPTSRSPPRGVVRPGAPPLRVASSGTDRVDAGPRTVGDARTLESGILLEDTPTDRIAAEPSGTHVSDNNWPGDPSAAQIGNRNGPDQNRELFTEMSETLKNINRVLIASQNSLARGFNSCRYSHGTGYTLGEHSLINGKGETPEVYGLPTLKGGYYYQKSFQSKHPSDFDRSVLARYLSFYNIGAETIEEGEELKVKSGMEGEARRLLSELVYIR